DVARQEDDALLEEAREDVERPLAAGRLLDDHRYQCHRTSYDSESIWAFSISRFRTLASRRLSRRWSRSPPRWSTPRTAWGGRPDSRAIRAISASTSASVTVSSSRSATASCRRAHRTARSAAGR